MGRKNKSSKQENNNNVARYVKINFDDNERFIKTITFDRSKDEKTWWEEKEWFYPFKEGTKICFNDWMKEILEFYFKNKDWFNKEKADSVVERMKINVIVWENGTGKSRLLGKIYQYIYNKEKENEEKGQKDVFLDSIALFDYLRTKKSEWGAKKENISQEITKFMEISKWSHNKWILDRYLRFIVLYVVLLRRFKLNDILWPVVIGKNLKELKFKIGNVDLVEKFEKCLTNRKWEHFWKCIDKSLNKLFELDNIESRDIFSDNINLLLRLSSWQNSLLIRFSMILSFILSRIYEKTNKNKKSFIILIDEPDLHLHLEWQRQYIQKLIDVFWNFLKDNTDISLHFIIATHSPFILSDIPAENVILLKREWGYTKVTDWWWNEFKSFGTIEEYNNYILNKKYSNWTFWANFVDLIRNWFFFKDKNLMGSFVEEVINEVAEKRRQEIIKWEEIDNKEEKTIKEIENKIWDTFLRDNLLYFKKSDAKD